MLEHSFFPTPDRVEFYYRNTIIYGIGCRNEVATKLNQLGAKRVVILTDTGVKNAGVADMISEALKDTVIELVGIYDGFIQDARVTQINEAVRMMKTNKADGVIALGGGSVLDSTKMVIHLIAHGRDDLAEVLQDPIFDFKPLMPHIAFPTTSGTGCEISPAAVIYDEQEKKKVIVFDPFSSSDVAMLDPELVVGLPPKVTAFTGMDALTHAIESYTNITPGIFGDGMSLQAVRMIARWLPKAVKNGADLTARGQMMVAATTAVIGSTGLGAVHATAHALGGRFGIPHGLANTIMLPWVMEVNLESQLERFRDVAQAMGAQVDRLSEKEGAIMAVQKVRELIKEVGITETLGSFGITEKKIEDSGLVDLALMDMLLGTNPKELEFDDIKELFLKAI